MSELVEAKQNAMLSIIEKVAMDPNANVDKMEKMLDMQERIFDKNAEIEFNKSMVECQKNMPIVLARGWNSQTSSLYVKYEHLIQDIKPTYTGHGFSLSFGEAPCNTEGSITVTCDVMHLGGHTRNYSSTLPIDSCGIKGTVNKTGIHATSSAYTYAKRYLATMIFNIAIADHDDDAIQAGGITVESLLEYLGDLRNNFASVSAMKIGLMLGTEEGLTEASNALWELTGEERKSICRAPSKGGIFTTDEREIMSTDSFRELTYPKKDK